MAQMKEQIKPPEKERYEMEIANLLGAELKKTVIRILREITEYSKSINKEMKVPVSEIKKNPQGTNSERKEARIQINDLENKEEINIQPELKEARIKKNKERQRTKMAA